MKRRTKRTKRTKRTNKRKRRGGEGGGGSLSKISSEETLSKLRLKLNQNKAKSTKHAGRPADFKLFLMICSKISTKKTVFQVVSQTNCICFPNQNRPSSARPSPRKPWAASAAAGPGWASPTTAGCRSPQRPTRTTHWWKVGETGRWMFFSFFLMFDVFLEKKWKNDESWAFDFDFIKGSLEVLTSDYTESCR